MSADAAALHREESRDVRDDLRLADGTPPRRADRGAFAHDEHLVDVDRLRREAGLAGFEPRDGLLERAHVPVRRDRVRQLGEEGIRCDDLPQLVRRRAEVRDECEVATYDLFGACHASDRTATIGLMTSRCSPD